MNNVRFFWIGEDTEIFVAESITQLIEGDNHRCGTGVERHEIDGDGTVRLYGDDGDELEWGELDGVATRMTFRNCDDNERRLETLTGNLFDLYAWTDGGRFGLPVMFSTAYA
ncbi:hypothetical protein [Paraburkholderia hospita]|uniref:hypothetical protein n=1 Tax=Paraburkholderia hospita TaxID=169430 RepID=UPI000B348FF1|nr:hypothetical protein [Paraburkholderia hospita]OUL79903.1 hypothetical protein CA603_33025 [Paraburkholderia hospita]